MATAETMAAYLAGRTPTSADARVPTSTATVAQNSVVRQPDLTTEENLVGDDCDESDEQGADESGPTDLAGFVQKSFQWSLLWKGLRPARVVQGVFRKGGVDVAGRYAAD